MNERIKELAEQAGVEIELDDYGETRVASAYGNSLERFAELIVQECAMLCRQEGENKFNNVWEQVRAKCDAQMILEYFGVEE